MGVPILEFEIEYTDREGQKRYVDIQGWEQARETAKRIAVKTGRRTVVRRIAQRQWRMYAVRLDDLSVVETSLRLTKREAIEFWRQWRELREGAVCVFWPRWAPPLRIVDFSSKNEAG